MSDRVGQRFGDYRLIRSLGEGTYGDVYYAEHVHEKKPAAVKVFKEKLTPDKYVKFMNEVRTVLLRHANIVPIIDFGIREDDEIGYLVMEYAPNGTLRQRHPQGTRLPLSTIITYVKQIAAALQYAHDHRRIHRDVKPGNLLLGANNELLLSDFGLVVVAHTDSSLTLEDLGGSPAYMAPEQWEGKPLPASDQYALGIVVYEWLCGTPPFRGSFTELNDQHHFVPPPPLREKIPTILPTVEQVVMRALAKDPQQRFPSIQAFSTALEQALLPPRKIALFGYETDGGRTSALWTNPGAFSLNETFQRWSETKRAFREGEIIDSTWVKVSDHGYSFVVHFFPQGQFHESPLLDPSRQLQGSWKLIDGILRTNIEQNEHGTLVKYELDIFASRNGSMHSGIEFRDDKKTAQAYFVLLPSRHLNTKHFEEALAAFDQILRVNHNSMEAYKAKGTILRNLGRYEEALMAFDRAIAIDDKKAWVWYEKGETFRGLKRYKEALTAYDRAIQIDPNAAWFWHQRGETLRELQRYQEALASYEQALKVDPQFAKSYNGIGNVLYRYLNRYEEAVAAYQRATELQPDYMWAWHNMGNVLHELRRFEDALIAYRRTTEIDPDYMWAWYNKGDVLHELGHHEEALEAFDQAIKRDDRIAVTWREKGKTLQDLQRYEEALASYERALELESQYASIWTRKGQVLRMLKRHEEAITAYDQALQLEANDVDAYLGKGRVYLDLERYEEALAVYEQATKIAPNNTWTWHDKGVALMKLDRAEQGLVAFEKAIELNPANRWAWRHKAETLEKLAQQADERASQLTCEEEQEISEVIDEPIHVVKHKAKGTVICKIVSEFSGKVLDVQEGAQEDGTAIIQYHYHGGLNQQWELIPVEEDFFKIASCLNGKVLDVWNHDREDGAKVVLHRYLGGANQHWQLVLIDGVSFAFKIISQESGKVLDVWNYGREDGAKIVLHRYLGGTNQHWRLVRISQPKPR